MTVLFIFVNRFTSSVIDEIEPFHVLNHVTDQMFKFEAHTRNVVHTGKVEALFASVKFSLVMGDNMHL